MTVSRPPNIVLIVADDMGYGDFAAFNGGLSCTPTLDALMADGLTLTQHYSAAPVCAPARAALLTGRYPHRTGVTGVLEVRGQDRLGLREVTLADTLRAAGYATGLVGKWHLGAIGPSYHPNARGFDEFVGFCGGWSDYYNWTIQRNSAYESADGRYLTDVFSEEAVHFVRRHAAEPFFLHLTYTAPHSPFQAPAHLVQRYMATGPFNEPVSTIYAMIEVMDAGVGRLVDELRQQGIENDTLLLFTSDNGPRFRDSSGGVDTTRFNCGYAGAKMSVYEGGIRVPMILRWPGVLPAGRFDRMVHFVDWLPTLLAAVGAERPAGPPLDGANVLPVLQGGAGQPPDMRCWQWNHYEPVSGCNAAIRRGDWKLVRPAIPEAMAAAAADWERDRAHKRDPAAWTDIYRAPEPERKLSAPRPLQLFNIAADPCEQHDRAADERALAEELAVSLEEWFADVMTEWSSQRTDREA